MSQEEREARKREAMERGIKYEENEEEQKLKKKRLKEESDDEEEEEEDDEDEDDEDEDEEEEEEHTSSARKRKRNKKKRGIFDAEASEGSSDEAEEGGELDEDALEDDLNPAQKKRLAERLENQKRFEKANPEDIARLYEDMYRKDAQTKGTGTKFSGAATIETARLMRERPRTEDPKLFMVRCKPGEEKTVVLKLYTKYIRDKFKKPEPVDPDAPRSRWSLPPPPGAELEIFSVVAPGTTGYIYVEAMREDCVKAAVRGVSGIFSGTISIVPLEEMQDVLRIEMRKDIIRKDDYVRMRGPYPFKGDLAQVVAILEGGNKLTVKLVPRIDMSMLSVNLGAKSQNRALPPAKLFNADEIRAVGGSVGRDATDTYDTFDDLNFENGLLLLEVNQRQVQVLTDKPSLDELENFSRRAVGDLRDDAVVMAEEVRKTASKQKQQHFDFAVGDRVLVVSGAESGVRGTLENIDLLRGLGMLRSTQGLKIDVQLKDMVKSFSAGDHVKILVGKHAGKTGNIVNVPTLPSNQRPYVFVYLDFGGEEVQVFNSDLKISSETSAGLESLDGYKQYDLVMLDQGLHGIVVRVNSDTLRILTQNGDAKELPTTQIRAKKNNESKHASTPDMNNHPLSATDQVVVSQGPYRGVEGLIKHIHRSLLFLYCKAREHENAGIIVVKARDVRIAGSFQAPQNRPGGAPRAVMRPPHGGGGGGRRHDEWLGKMVRIKKGNDKGLVGTVVEGGSATVCRVELNARNKIINVPRENLQMEVREPTFFEPAHTYGDDVRGGSGSGMAASSNAYPTPMYDYSESYSSRSTQPARSTGAPLQVKKDDTVKLVDSGEEVTVFEVMDRDIVVIGSNGQMKVVSVSNVARV